VGDPPQDLLLVGMLRAGMVLPAGMTEIGSQMALKTHLDGFTDA
jgi:hypothetical protein